jgi:hypothetical protein
MDTPERIPHPLSYMPEYEQLVEVQLEHSPVILVAHPFTKCDGTVCALHNRTDHAMRSFPQHWRYDRGLIERICPHGVGHPDPDQRGYLVQRYGERRADAEFIHGCCWERCCVTGNNSNIVTAE